MAVRSPWKTAPRRSPGDLEHEEDRSLAKLAAEGDEEAFAAIFQRHHRGLLTLSRHMLGSREEAEDVLQHTFAAAYRQLVEGGPPEHMRAWLYATARNRCSSVLRARRELPQEEIAAATAWLPDEVESRSDLRDLLDDIQRLPEDQRVALVLTEIEDLDHAEIAEVLGCRRDKVRALVFQARSTLGGWREARATPCREVREEIAVARGPQLRRAYLSRHLAVCPDCTAYRKNVDEQRRRVALLLPPVPIALALKEGLVEAAIAGAAGGGAGGAATAASGGAAAGGAAAAGGGIVTAAKVGAAALVIGGVGVVGFGGLGGGGEDSSERSQQPDPPPAEPQAADPDATATARASKQQKQRARAEKRFRVRERNRRASPPESVEEPTASAPVGETAASQSSSGQSSSLPATPSVPSVPAVPDAPQPPAPPAPPPAPEAPLEAVPQLPTVEAGGEIRATPPVDPQEVLP
jgi:RNA polymerase sigma factor (sigma-70 family)